MAISEHSKPYSHRNVFLIISCLLASVLSGCANTPLQRASVEKLKNIHVVQVVTPALEAPTFLQAAFKTGAVGGLVPALMVQEEAKNTLTPSAIPDFGALVTEKLKRRLQEQVSWWPPMTSHEGAVPGNFVYQSGDWLRVDVYKYEVAAGGGRLFIGVNASLRNAQDRGEPLWVKQKLFSGLVHGGEKIIMENLPNDPSQLNRELERAAEWLAAELAADIR